MLRSVARCCCRFQVTSSDPDPRVVGHDATELLNTVAGHCVWGVGWWLGCYVSRLRQWSMLATWTVAA